MFLHVGWVHFSLAVPMIELHGVPEDTAVPSKECRGILGQWLLVPFKLWPWLSRRGSRREVLVSFISFIDQLGTNKMHKLPRVYFLFTFFFLLFIKYRLSVKILVLLFVLVFK